MQKLLEQLEAAMDRQQELIVQFGTWEREINEYVRQRRWAELQEVMQKAGALSSTIEACEEERNKLFLQLCDEVGEDSDAGFYQVMIHLPEECRERLSVKFRELKMSVVKLRGLVWGIDAYVKAVQGTIRDLIGEMSPSRKGTIYAKSGGARSPETGPLVLNRQL